MKNIKELLTDRFLNTQQSVADQFSIIDQQKPIVYSKRPKGANGSDVIYFNNGKCIEKGFVFVGINYNVPVSENLAKMFLSENLRANFSDYTYFLVNTSVSMFPHSPLIPSFNAHCQYFEICDKDKNIVFWFFGATTFLDPFYLFDKDITHFHSVIKEYCEKVEPGFYNKGKKQADKYFFSHCRNHHLGVGGIYFRNLSNHPRDVLYDFICNFCDGILPSYLPIVEKRINEPYTEEQKYWQLILRGRYIEFLFIYDETFHYGLKSGVNKETIFMCVPFSGTWDSLYTPKPDSPEDKMMNVLKTPRDWA